MTLTAKVRKVKEALDDRQDRESLKRAEQLADQFSDIKPQPLAMPVEKYFGMPAVYDRRSASLLRAESSDSHATYTLPQKS